MTTFGPHARFLGYVLVIAAAMLSLYGLAWIAAEIAKLAWSAYIAVGQWAG